jgi:hypothetical protein
MFGKKGVGWGMMLAAAAAVMTLLVVVWIIYSMYNATPKPFG